MICSTLHLLLAFGLTMTVSARPPSKPAEATDSNAPKHELTRDEISKLGGFEAAPADPPAPIDPGPVNLDFDLLMVVVPDNLATPIADMFADPTKVDAACQKLMSLVEAKKATVSAWPRIQTKSGNRAVAENIEEVRYATEFSKAPVDKNAKPNQAAPQHAEPPQGPIEVEAQGAFPTAFETRNAGATLEVEPVLGPDGKTMDLNLCAQHVRLLGFDSTTIRENGETKISVPQPRFQTNKVTQNISIRAGGRVLLGTYRLTDAPDQMEFFILRANVAPVAPVAPKRK